MERSNRIEVWNRWDAAALLQAFADRGSFMIERGGHYLQYERAEVFNEAVQMFCQDLLTQRASPRGTRTPSLG